MDLLRYFEQEQMKTIDRPRLKPGDVVRITTKVAEGDKKRLQAYEGTILGIRGQGPSATFTVRREVGRFAVERIFPLYSPIITDIEITQRQKVRRAKLTYLRAAGRRRVKADEKATQRHTQEQAAKKRLADVAAKKAADEKAAAQAVEARKTAEAEARKEVAAKGPEASTVGITAQKNTIG